MVDLLRQEFYKFFHQKWIWWAPIAILPMMMFLAFGVSATSGLAKYYTMIAFDAPIWIDILIAVVASGVVISDFNYGTMKRMVVEHSRLSIFAMKFIVVSVYTFILYLLSFLATFLLKWVAYGTHFSFFSMYTDHHLLITDLAIGRLGWFLTAILVISLVFMIASFSRSTAGAVGIGAIFVFLGPSLSGMIVQKLGKAFPIVKWNPFNMFAFGIQIVDPASLTPGQVGLSDFQLFIGTVLWILLFSVIGYVAFKHKKI